jgi:hypothetical protein
VFCLKAVCKNVRAASPQKKKIAAAGHCMLSIDWLLAIGIHWLLAVGFWLLAIGYWLLAVGCCILPVVCCMLSLAA